jgi:hypothetical protein
MRRSGEHGGIAPLMAGLMLVLLTILVGASAVGRLAMLRADAQRAADAACMVAANVVRQEGLPLNGQEKQRVGQIALRNFPGARLDIQVKDEETYVEVACRAEIDVEVPWGTETVRSNTKSRAPQIKYTDTKEIKPRLVMVLDYSGSMQAPMVNDPGGRSSVAVLRDSVRVLLGLNLPVIYGAVFFDSGVSKVAMGPEAPDQIRQRLGRQPANLTNTAGALHAAFEILRDTPKDDPEQANYVLLVSDGQPTCCGNGDVVADARAEAAQLRSPDGQDAVLIALHIRNSPNADAAAALEQFMRAVAAESDPTNPGMYLTASTDAELKAKFEEMAGLIACPVTLKELPPPGSKMFFFLRSPGGDEGVLRDLREVKPGAVQKDLNDPNQNFRNQNLFWLAEEKKRIYVSKSVCDKMLKADHIIVTRYQRPGLSE